MAKNTGSGFFSILGSVFTWVRWIFSGIFIVMLFIFGAKLYPILKDCWTCNIFSSMYDAFSIVGAQTVKYFQENLFVLISVCLALWIVYETYKALEPSLTFMAPDEPKFDDDFFKKIYKKLFLTMAVIGLFIINEPRNIFSNTFELTLDFGSSISRQFIRNKIDESQIPSECVKTPKELSYTGDGVLSDNTRDDMVCLLKEVNILRHNYMDIGIALFEYGKKDIEILMAETVLVKTAFFVGGKIIGSKFGKKALKRQNKKLEKLKKDVEKNKDKIEKLEKSIDAITKDLKSGGKKQKQLKTAGKIVNKSGDFVAAGNAIIQFLKNKNINMGLAGLGMAIGLFIINMFFAFIIIEKILWLGVSILLLPLLAACYIFEQTRNFATKSLQDTFSFAIGLIFMSVAMVMCAEINDWILGGMFSAPDASNISRTTEAIALIKAGRIDEFNNLVGTNWYFVYVIFVIGVDALLIKSAGEFASWFNGSLSEANLAKPLWKMGTSAYKTTTSVVREIKNYVKRGETKEKDAGGIIDKFLGNRRVARQEKKAKKEAKNEK